MPVTMRRPILRTWSAWQPVTYRTSGWRRPLGGGALAVIPGPGGPVGPVPGTDLSHNGMDPSDPVTWTRPYVPMAGMVARLNFDGAVTNPTQTGPNPRRRRRRRKGAA